MANYDNDIFVAHVYSGNLEFSDEILLTYSGTGKMPYIAKIGTPSYTHLKGEILSKGELLVYPNPADEKITVVLNEKELISGMLIITDLSGHFVLRQSCYENNQTIDINDLQAGVYLVQVQLNNGSFRKEKIIIY